MGDEKSVLEQLKEAAAAKLAGKDTREAVELLAKIAMELVKDALEGISPAFVRPLEDMGAEKLEDLAERALDSALTKLGGGASTVTDITGTPEAAQRAVEAAAQPVVHIDAALMAKFDALSPAEKTAVLKQATAAK